MPESPSSLPVNVLSTIRIVLSSGPSFAGSKLMTPSEYDRSIALPSSLLRSTVSTASSPYGENSIMKSTCETAALPTRRRGAPRCRS
jgi:hypothetical protein